MYAPPPTRDIFGSTFFPAVGSGVLLGLAFPFSHASAPFQGWLALIAYVPLLLRYLKNSSDSGSDRTTQSRNPVSSPSILSAGRWFAEGLVVHLIAYAIAFHWVVFHPMVETVLASIGAIMGLALLASIPWAVAAGIVRWDGRLGLPAWALLAWAIEHALSYGSWALPWPVLSMTQGSLPHATLAAVVGAPGLAAIVILVNAGTALAFSRVRHRSTRPVSPQGIRNVSTPGVLLAMLFVTGALATGLTTSTTTSAEQVVRTALDGPTDSAGSSANLRLLLVQPSVPATDWARQNSRDNTDVLIRLTTSRFGSNGKSIPSDTVDLVVWPESALTLFYFAITDSMRAPSRVPAALLTGGIMSASSRSTGSSRSTASSRSASSRSASTSKTPTGTERVSAASRSLHNRALLYVDGASPPKTYAKHHLVPFAERVPGVGRLPFLEALSVPSGGVTTYEPGPGPVLFSTRDLRPDRSDMPSPVSFAPLICFETVVGPYVRQAARRGAELFVGLSQVGWWGNSAVLPQYQILTTLRAIETGRPIVVNTVSGPSFTATPQGDIHRHTRWQESTTRVVTPSAGGPTWYLEHAKLMHVALASLLVAGAWLLSKGSGGSPPKGITFPPDRWARS